MPKEIIIERSIVERTKLRRGKFDEIERKEQNIKNELFKAYFTDYQSPSNMYKKLSKSKDAVNKVWVKSIQKVQSCKITKNHWSYTYRKCSQDWREWKVNSYCWKDSWV